MKQKIIGIVSGKGGVGKTTSAINLGGSLNNLGKEVIVVDANLATPNVGLHLGTPIVPVTLNQVIARKARPEEAIYEHDSGLKILPASLALADLKKTLHQRIPDVIKRLRKIGDFVVVSEEDLA